MYVGEGTFTAPSEGSKPKSLCETGPRRVGFSFLTDQLSLILLEVGQRLTPALLLYLVLVLGRLISLIRSLGSYGYYDGWRTLFVAYSDAIALGLDAGMRLKMW
jgi:hypothetical protein